MGHEDRLKTGGSVTEIEGESVLGAVDVGGGLGGEGGRWGRVGDSSRTPRGRSRALGIASTAKGRWWKRKHAMKACSKVCRGA